MSESLNATSTPFSLLNTYMSPILNQPLNEVNREQKILMKIVAFDGQFFFRSISVNFCVFFDFFSVKNKFRKLVKIECKTSL
jgi:hypothetical protein